MTESLQFFFKINDLTFRKTLTDSRECKMSLKLKYTSESYSDQSKFPAFTLILPSVSVGNVGQLALDVFLSSVQPEKVADVWDEALLPVVGKIDYTQVNISVLDQGQFQHS